MYLYSLKLNFLIAIKNLATMVAKLKSLYRNINNKLKFFYKQWVIVFRKKVIGALPITNKIFKVIQLRLVIGN
jgi:hypothetical protein